MVDQRDRQPQPLFVAFDWLVRTFVWRLTKHKQVVERNIQKPIMVASLDPKYPHVLHSISHNVLMDLF